MLLDADIRKMLVDGTQWARWHGYHIPVSEERIVIWTPAGTEMHWRPRTWVAQKHQLTYFWCDAWYTIHVGYDLNGDFLSGYCDVILPNAEYSNTAQELVYTDLYIDVVVREDYSVFTKDHEVYERAARHFPIVEQVRQQSFEVLDWLEHHAAHWTGPFEYIPRHLSRTDFETLNPDEAVAALRTSS